MDQGWINCVVFPGIEDRKGSLCAGIERLLVDGDGGAERPPQQRRKCLPQREALFCLRDPPPRPERHHISAGDGDATVECCFADNLAEARLEDMGMHFLPRRNMWLQDR